MAYNSGGANPIGVKTVPRPGDGDVPPVNQETLDSIESKADASTDKGTTKREGIVGNQGSHKDETKEMAKEVAADHEAADKLRKK